MQYTLNIKNIALLIALVANSAHATHLVSLSIRAYPLSEKNIAHHLAHPLNRATHLQTFLNESKLVSGIFATYAGYICISDYDGRITFPRLQQSARLYIIVTPQITPIMWFHNTIHHWEFNKGESVKMVLLEQKTDEQTEIVYWDAQEVPIPANNEIPLESVTILANPDYIYIPLGITPTTHSPHLLLPDIYIKPGFNKVDESLYMLNQSRFFGSLSLLYRLEKKNMRSMMKL